MPTVARIGPYRFHFYSNERNEPPHVHAKRDSAEAKFWLDPVSIASSGEFTARELREIERIIITHATEWKGKWNEHFNRNR